MCVLSTLPNETGSRDIQPRDRGTGSIPFTRQHPGAARRSNQDLQDSERQSHRDPWSPGGDTGVDALEGIYWQHLHWLGLDLEIEKPLTSLKLKCLELTAIQSLLKA